jgi:DNA-binding transcriptional regulator YiaG
MVESLGFANSLGPNSPQIVRGERAPSREFYVDAAKVKEIRSITGLSQPQFAKLLHVDKNNPQAVWKALAA